MTVPLPEEQALPGQRSRHLCEGAAVRYCLEIAYDGSGFHGWQKQEPPEKPPLRTVQGVVEQTLRELLGQPLSLLGASRTDTGVHAQGQRAQFDARPVIPLERLAMAINGRLPDDVAVRGVQIVAAGFDVIRDVISKQYVYTLFHTHEKPLGLRHLVYHCWTPLDLDRMNDAAQRLVGRHDFAGLAAARHGRQSTVRTILACDVRCEDGDERRVRISVEGDGFLYNMVRILAGTLVEVGRGRFEPAQVDRILATADRAHAGPTLPPHGLCLQWIRFRTPEVAPAATSGTMD